MTVPVSNRGWGKGAAIVRIVRYSGIMDGPNCFTSRWTLSKWDNSFGMDGPIHGIRPYANYFGNLVVLIMN